MSKYYRDFGYLELDKPVFPDFEDVSLLTSIDLAEIEEMSKTHKNIIVYKNKKFKLYLIEEDKIKKTVNLSYKHLRKILIKTIEKNQTVLLNIHYSNNQKYKIFYNFSN